MGSELPLVPLVQGAKPERDGLWMQRARLAKRLSWTSLAWLCIEGGVAVTAGIIAASVALVGFGLDSAVEGLASIIVVWRFTGNRTVGRHGMARSAAARRVLRPPAR